MVLSPTKSQILDAQSLKQFSMFHTNSDTSGILRSFDDTYKIIVRRDIHSYFQPEQIKQFSTKSAMTRKTAKYLGSQKCE